MIHGGGPLAETRQIGASGRQIWRDGRNIIIRDPTSGHGGTALQKRTEEAAKQYYDDFQ